MRELAITLAALLSLGGGAVARAAGAQPGKPRPQVCQHRQGRTVFHRGPVRVFEPPGGRGSLSGMGEVYGCLKGSTRAVALWQTGAERTGSVQQLVGHCIAVNWEFSNQYGFNASLSVHNLATGTGYTVASAGGPLGGPPTGTPNAFSWPLDGFVLGPDGRSARLYGTYPANAATESNPSPNGEVLDVIGPHHFKRILATAQPGTINSSSLAFNGNTVTWTESGVPESATV